MEGNEKCEEEDGERVRETGFYYTLERMLLDCKIGGMGELAPTVSDMLS
jgi:hypothetical protein